MKQTRLVIGLLLASASQAIKLRDIFDAYDQESALEQTKNEDSIDPQALAAEIGGEEIARDVIQATGGIQESTMLQLSDDLDSGPTEKERAIIERINGFRRFEQKDESEEKINKKAFEYVNDIENTHSTYPRQFNNGFIDRETAPSLAEKF
jgi:hypothetical protein